MTTGSEGADDGVNSELHLSPHRELNLFEVCFCFDTYVATDTAAAHAPITDNSQHRNTSRYPSGSPQLRSACEDIEDTLRVQIIARSRYIYFTSSIPYPSPLCSASLDSQQLLCICTSWQTWIADPHINNRHRLA